LAKVWSFHLTSARPFDPERFVDEAATAVGLSIPPDDRAAVVENFGRIAAMAQFMMAFPVADDIDPATVFRP
jgi:hypothetical protein